MKHSSSISLGFSVVDADNLLHTGATSILHCIVHVVFLITAFLLVASTLNRGHPLSNEAIHIFHYHYLDMINVFSTSPSYQWSPL